MFITLIFNTDLYDLKAELLRSNVFLQGYVATKLGQEGVCYVSTMNRVLTPALNSIALLAEETSVR